MMHSEPFHRKMKLGRVVRAAAISFCLIGLLGGQSLAAVYVADQFYTPNLTPGWGLNIRYLGPVGQSFTPAQGLLNTVELFTEYFASEGTTGVNLQVAIHDGGSIGGTVLGVSDSLFLSPLFRGVSRFDFSSALRLAPGQQYTLEARYVSGDPWGIFAYQSGSASNPGPDLYAGGTMFDGLGANHHSELWFREGYDPSGASAPVPEPGTMILLGSGLVGLVGYGRRRFRR